jgi:hypothetical protein
LPTNLEIEDALRAYQALYQADEHPEQLQHLRRLALEMMRLLEAFSPHLTGPVLSGSAGRHAEIHLHLYTDDMKELEVFLLNREIPFRTRETRVWSGDASSVVPSFLISSTDADYSVTVLGTRHQRQPLRMTSDGRPLERATIQSVESLVTGAGQ